VAAKTIRGMDLENLRDHYWNILSLEQSRLGIPIHGIHGSRCPISERILARGSPGKTMDSTRGNRQIAKGIGGFDRFQEYDIWIYLVGGFSPYPSEK